MNVKKTRISYLSKSPDCNQIELLYRISLNSRVKIEVAQKLDPYGKCSGGKCSIEISQVHFNIHGCYYKDY